MAVVAVVVVVVNVVSQVDAVHPMGLAFVIVVMPIQQAEEKNVIANVKQQLPSEYYVTNYN